MSRDWNLLEWRKTFFRSWRKFFSGVLFSLFIVTATQAIAEDAYEVNGVVIKVIGEKSTRVCVLDTDPAYAVESYDKSAIMISEREYIDRKSTRLNSSHSQQSRMPSSA